MLSDSRKDSEERQTCQVAPEATELSTMEYGSTCYFFSEPMMAVVIPSAM
jgi:hypothetical protein